MTEYEITLVTREEKIKILIAKIVLALFIAYEFYELIFATGDLSSRTSSVGSILLFTFAYINVLQVKHEFALLFEPPYLNHGLEIFFASLPFFVVAWLL